MNRSDKYSIVSEDLWIAADTKYHSYIKEQKKIFDKDPYFEEVINVLQEIASTRINAFDMEAISTDDMYDGPSKDSIIYMEDLDKNSNFDLEPLTETEKCTALAPVEYHNMFDTSAFKTKAGEDTSTVKRIKINVNGKISHVLTSRSITVCEQNKQLIDNTFLGVKSFIDDIKMKLAAYSPELLKKIIDNRNSNRKIKDPVSNNKMPYHLLYGNISTLYIELKTIISGDTLIFGTPVSNAFIYNDKVTVEITE